MLFLPPFTFDLYLPCLSSVLHCLLGSSGMRAVEPEVCEALTQLTQILTSSLLLLLQRPLFSLSFSQSIFVASLSPPPKTATLPHSLFAVVPIVLWLHYTSPETRENTHAPKFLRFLRACSGSRLLLTCCSSSSLTPHFLSVVVALPSLTALLHE